MRLLSATLAVLAAISVSACDLWPRELEQFAQGISRQVSGEATAWLVAGDVMVITVAGSPFYRGAESEVEALATEIAEQAIAFSTTPLESVAITFYEGEVSEDPEEMREFIFLVMENRPVLQPYLDVDARGPLTLAEVQTLFTEVLAESLTADRMECVRAEVEKLARDAGDPETLDPERVEFLAADTWFELDAFAKRLILAQAITTSALFTCGQHEIEPTSSRKSRKPVPIIGR
jgi:hypothetical protein